MRNCITFEENDFNELEIDDTNLRGRKSNRSNSSNGVEEDEGRWWCKNKILIIL